MSEKFQHAEELRPQWVFAWKLVLSKILNWPESRIDSWLACFISELDGTDVDGSMWLYHDPVLRKITPLFVHDELAHHLQQPNSQNDRADDLSRLHDDLERAATFTNDNVYCDAPDYCWDAAHQRVMAVLEKHNSSIPLSTYTTKYEKAVRSRT